MPGHRRPLALSVAAGALAWGAPVIAQSDATYEYAQPAPDEPVIFSSDPVVQPLPGRPAPLPQPVETASYAYDTADVPPPLPPEPPVPPMPPMPPQPMAAPHAVYAAPAYAAAPPPYGARPGYGAPYPGYGYPMAADFDRGAWLDDCRMRIRGVDRKDRAGVIGGLLGAVAGGVIGNRAWDSKRLAGTLLGAGVGGLAGVAIGTAVGAASERRHDDECSLYLDRYMSEGYAHGGYAAGGYTGYAYGYPGYGYGGYTLVPVLVAIPQRQVVRETVTEEWIDEPVRTRSIPRAHRPAAPRGDKRIKLTKGN